MYRSTEFKSTVKCHLNCAFARYTEMTSSPFTVRVSMLLAFYFVYCAIWRLRFFFLALLRIASYCGRRRQVHGQRKKRVIVFAGHVFFSRACFYCKLFSNVFDHLKATLRRCPKRFDLMAAREVCVCVCVFAKCINSGKCGRLKRRCKMICVGR